MQTQLDGVNLNVIRYRYQTRKEERRKGCGCDFGEWMAAMAAIGWGFFTGLFSSPQTLLLLRLDMIQAPRAVWLLVQLFGIFTLFCGLLQYLFYAVGPDSMRRRMAFIMAVNWGFIAGMSIITGIWLFGFYIDLLFATGNGVVFLKLGKKIFSQGHG